MKKFTLFISLVFSTFSFAQIEQGTMTFGAGQMLISTAGFDGYQADASYFVIDRLMLSLSISGSTEVGDEEDWDYAEAQNQWGFGIRYYLNPGQGLFTGLNINNTEYQKRDSDGDLEWENDGSEDMETGMDLRLYIGYSKEIIEHIWFEPQFTFYQPSGAGDMPLNYGLGAQFRFAF